MKDKMIRVKGDVIESLKVLKKVFEENSYSGIIDKLIYEKLLTVAACTQDGFLLPGAVVQDLEGNVLVITDVVNGKVLFNDQSYLFNGSTACRELVKLSDNMESYTGGRTKA